MTAVASYRRAGERRQRELVTPEGLSLPLTVGARFDRSRWRIGSVSAFMYRAPAGAA